MPMPWGLIAAACVGMFAATASGSIRSPFLPDMAADFTALCQLSPTCSV